jgi:hypothetical protein
MTSKYSEEKLSRIRPISISDRSSKVSVDQIIDPEQFEGRAPNALGADLTHIFPNVLKGADLKRVADALREARQNGRPILWLVGAHVIKCGLSLYVNSLIRRGYIDAIATTGSSTVHDLELAFFGKTSEDVAVELPEGRFGMSVETAAHFSTACKHAEKIGLGLGEGIGTHIGEEKAPFSRFSVYACANEHSVPATVHVALGTDITHQHPDFPAGVVGELSMRDFRILAAVVGKVFDRGVVVVFGSAVVLPEVFLKCVSIQYNLGRRPKNVTAVNFDMFQQYRVRENVLTRPFQGAGTSYSFSGHHEIMLPLLYHLLGNA